MVKQASIFPEVVMGRTIEPEPPNFLASNVGYIGNGPGPAPDPRQTYLNLRDIYREKSSDGTGILKTLFIIGGASIASKWLVSKLIESKMQEMREEIRRENSSPVKIVLVKSAEQAFTTQQLVKASLLNSLKTGL
jgi:hypothetical protein